MPKLTTHQLDRWIDKIDEVDKTHRTAKDVSTTVALLSYYKDQAASITHQRMAELGVGIRDNTRPLQVGLLRYAIDRQAVTYSSPPTRWLIREGKRLPSSHVQTRMMRDIYRDARIDARWRKADRLRNVTAVVGMRTTAYPTLDGSSVDVRVTIYTPDKMIRAPDPRRPTEITQDVAFALRNGGDQYEIFIKDHATAGWYSYLHNKGGPETEGHWHGTLPFILVYDDDPEEAWPAPREHRHAAVDAINAMANDQWANVRATTHSTRIWRGIPPEQVPQSRGPGTEVAVPDLPSQVEVEDLEPKAQIDAASHVLDQTVGHYLISEDLPPDDLDRSKQVLTGAALRTRLFGLIERRKGQALIAPGDERDLFRAVRSEYNLYATLLNRPTLANNTELEVQLAPMDLPIELATLVNTNKNRIENGTMSRIEAVMVERGVPRDEAETILRQVREDEANTTISTILGEGE